MPQKKVKCPYCPKMVRKGVDMRQHQDKHHADELKVHADEQERRKRDREKGYSPGRKKKNKPGPESPATDHDKSASSSATKGSGLVGWLNPTTPKNQGVGTSDKTRQKGHSNPTKQANITNSFAADSRTQQSKPFFEVADGLARTITSLSSNLSMHIKLWTTDAISRMDDASGGASGGGDSEDEVPLAVLAARQREKKRAEERRLRLSVSAAST